MNKLSDYEYSILDEVRRDEINQAIEKAEKHDELINGRYGILELNKIISDKRDEVQSLKSENKELLEQNVKLILGYKDLKSQLEGLTRLREKEMKMVLKDTKRYLDIIDGTAKQNEKLNKMIDEIKDYLLKITVKDKNYDIIKSIESILKEVEK